VIDVHINDDYHILSTAIEQRFLGIRADFIIAVQFQNAPPRQTKRTDPLTIVWLGDSE